MGADQKTWGHAMLEFRRGSEKPVFEIDAAPNLEAPI